MKPNDLGKAAGFTYRDGQRLTKAERDLVKARELIAEWEAVTGNKCERDGDCQQLLQAHEELRKRFFTEDQDEG